MSKTSLKNGDRFNPTTGPSTTTDDQAALGAEEKQNRTFSSGNQSLKNILVNFVES